MKVSLRWASAVGLAMAVLAGCGGSSGGGTPVVSSTGSVKQSSAPSTSASADAPSTQGSTPSPERPSAQNPSVTVIESKVSEGGQGRDVDPFRPMNGRTLPRASVIGLSAVAPGGAPAIQKSVATDVFVPLKVGVPREVAQTASAEATAASLAWNDGEAGAKVAALRFVSPGAEGIRLGVAVKSLPFGSKLRFYADGADTFFEIPGMEVLATLRRNTDAGDLREQAGIYWGPNLGGEAVTMEIEIPGNVDPASVLLSVPRLSHATVDIRKLGSLPPIGRSGICNADISCSVGYDELSKSVALMDFVADGSGGTTAGADYVCTGTLLNDRMATGTPWFLSAKHCIPNQTVASTLYTLWFYRSSSCGASTVSPSTAVLTTGATLLYVTPDAAAGLPKGGDTAFMRLASAPPAGAVFAGSNPQPLDYGTTIYDVHHPQGDLQKYSAGTFTGISSCRDSGCLTPASSYGNFMRVNWYLGVTEPGSSGSGAFARYNGKHYLVGQLFGGGSSCEAPFAPDFFGRFDVVFPALSQWLGATSGATRVPIYRLYNRKTGTHFYTSNPLERDMAVQKFPEFSYEGTGFYAYVATGTVSDSVYRFYNTRTGAHFFTISGPERDLVQASYPWYSYEGVAWYASMSAQNQASPLYRFYNTKTATHFYTISADERNLVIRNYPEYVNEGIGYYAWTAP